MEDTNMQIITVSLGGYAIIGLGVGTVWVIKKICEGKLTVDPNLRV